MIIMPHNRPGHNGSSQARQTYGTPQGGIPYTSQCVKVPPGASGSSISTASSGVPDGGVLHCRRGRRFAPSQVNSVGNAPAARSGLKTVSGGRMSLTGRLTAEPPHPISENITNTGPIASRDCAMDDGRPGCEQAGPGGQCAYLQASSARPL